MQMKRYRNKQIPLAVPQVPASPGKPQLGYMKAMSKYRLKGKPNPVVGQSRSTEEEVDLFPSLTPISFSFGRYVYEIIVTSCLHCLIPTATSKGISSTICNCTGLPPHSGIICSMRVRLLISRRNGYEETEPTFTPTDGGPPSVEIHLQEGTAPFHTFLPTHSRTHYAGQHC